MFLLDRDRDSVSHQMLGEPSCPERINNNINKRNKGVCVCVCLSVHLSVRLSVCLSHHSVQR